jgi:hypothetical protein
MKMNKLLSAIFFASVLFFQFSCQKDTSFERGVIAKGSIIKNSTNSCIATASGSYNVGSALTSNNFILDSINVTSAGSYSITTDTVNGIWFKATGKINNTGHFAVKLMGYGTPVTNGTFNYTLTYDSTSCVVSVFVDTAKSSGSGNTGGNSGSGGTNPTTYINCKINNVAVTFDSSASATVITASGAAYGLSIAGLANDGTLNSDSPLTLSITSLNKIGKGTYKAAVSSNGVICMFVPNTNYSANSWANSQTTASSAIVTISNITSTKVEGTFSATLKDNIGLETNSITVTSGSFSVPIQ